MADVQALQRQGWYLSTDGIQECKRKGTSDIDSITKAALNLDLKVIGERHLEDGICKNKVETVNGPFVLQIQKVHNVSAPKENEESHSAPPMFKLTLTDGHLTCVGLELEKVANLGLHTSPGTKILLSGRVPVCHGFLLLTPKRCRILGGHVEALVESWELKRTLAKHTRANLNGGEGGPPPFVPFGQKYKMDELTSPKRESFKSLASTVKEKKQEDGEFEQQRKATIAEALQAKEEGKGKQKPIVAGNSIQDRDVAKIIEMGFSAEQATGALFQSNGSLEGAINILLGVSAPAAPPSYEGRGRGRNNFHGQGPERPMRGGRRPRGGGGEEEESHTRPSAPATLFDFLTTKIPPPSSSTAAVRKSSSSHSNHSSKDFHESPSPANHQSSTYTTDTNTSCHSKHLAPPNLPPRLQRQHQRHGRHGESPPDDHGTNRGQLTTTAGRSDHGSRRPDLGATSRGPQRSQWTLTSGGHSGVTQRDSPTSHHAERHPPSTQHRDPRDLRKAQLARRDGWATRRPQANSNHGDRDADTAAYNSSTPYPSRTPHMSTTVTATTTSSNADTMYNTSPPSELLQQLHGLRLTGPPPPQAYSYPSVSAMSGVSGYSAAPQGYVDGTTTMATYNGVEPVHSAGQEMKCNQWMAGDLCAAKYWQDEKFYRAVVHSVNGETCAVTFTDYGNTEQVSVADLRSTTKQAWDSNMIDTFRGCPIQTTYMTNVVVATALSTYLPPPGFANELPPPTTTTTTPLRIECDSEFKRGAGGVGYGQKPQRDNYYSRN